MTLHERQRGMQPQGDSPTTMAPVGRPKETKRKPILVLFSGGADSVLMLLLAWKMRRMIDLLAIRYGQVHVQEIEMGLALTRRLEEDLKLAIRNVTIFENETLFRGIDSKLTGGTGNYPGVHEMHLPGRNGVFVAHALSHAEACGIEEVWIGCDYSDRENLFPDCYQEWVIRMNAVARCNGSRPITLKAPLLGLSKEDVKELLVAEGVDLSAVYSGYTPPK